MAKDISTVGAKIIFSGAINCTISEFSDEGTPFDAPDIDTSENGKNLNGEMISSRKAVVYPFSVTVIPGSVADQKLQNLLQKSSIQPGNVSAAEDLYVDCAMTIPAVYTRGKNVSDGGNVTGARTYTYTNARIKTGPTGPSSSAEGRQSARTYSFEAEGFDPA